MSIRVDVNGSASGFEQALNAAKKHAERFTQDISRKTDESLKGLMGGAAGGIASAFSIGSALTTWKEFLGGIFEAGKSIKETAEQFDLSTDSVQKWEKALGKAGITQGLFLRAIESVRQKRQEAQADASKLQAFTDIGLGNEAMNADVSDEDLLKRIVTSGASRTRINSLLGRKGASLKAAMPFLNGESDFGESDLEAMHAGEQMYKQVKHLPVLAFKHTVRGFREIFSMFKGNQFGQTEADDFGKELDQRRAEFDAAKRDKADNAKDRAREELHKKLIEPDADRAELEAQMGLRNSERGNMNIGQRRDSLRKELSTITKQILMDKSALDHGLSPDEKAALSPDEQRKLTERRKLNLLSDQAKKQGILGELRERPHDIHADTLSHSGLFTGAALRGATGADAKAERLINLVQQLVNQTNPRTGLARSSPFDP